MVVSRYLSFMKCLLLFHFVLILISGFAQQKMDRARNDSIMKAQTKAIKHAIGKPFPYFTITNDRLKLTSKDVIGKTIYINFWFASCSPCMAEMPYLNDIYQRFKQDTNFVFLSLTFDDSSKIKKVRAKFNIQYDMFSISMAECTQLNPSTSFPANIILNKEGKVLFYDVGSRWKPKGEKRYMEKLAKVISNCLNSG